MADVSIVRASEKRHWEDVRFLFKEYGESRNFDAALASFYEEINNPQTYYLTPRGEVILATYLTRAVGCVAFRPLKEKVCEMKRLYVRNEWRGKGLGRKLIQVCLSWAKKRDYSFIRLDTHPTMLAAQNLYAEFGFYEIPRYNNNPIKGIRFFEKKIG